MFKKYILILTILVFTIGMVHAEDNLTLSDADATLSEALPTDSIQEKINNASEGGIVDLKDDYEYSSNDISINKSITLNGVGNHSISANDHLHVNVTGGDVVFRNLNFKDFRQANGYLITNNAKLTLLNCTFLSTERSIENNGELNIINCTFKGSYNLNSNAGQVEVINSTFDKGYLGLNGDAARILDSTFLSRSSIDFYSRETLISNTRFRGNEALVFTNPVTIANSSFSKGSFKLKSAGYDIRDCDFTSLAIWTSLDDLKITGSNLDNVKFFNDDFKDLKLELDGCNAFNHTHVSLNGGSVYRNSNFTNVDIESVLDYDVLIDNCTFRDNTAEESLFEVQKSSSFSIMNSRFINNSCTNLFNLGYMVSEHVNFTDNSFINNTCNYLIKWYYELEYNSKRDGVWNAPRVSVDFSNNILINNLNTDNDYSIIYLHDMLMTSYNDPMVNPYKYTFKDNFFGFNMDDVREFDLLGFFDLDGSAKSQFSKTVFVNVELTKTGLRFVDADNKTVKMPDAVFHIKRGDNVISTVTVTKGEARVSLDELDSVNVLNEAMGLINRPKATLTYTVIGDNYASIKVTAHLSYNNVGLANERILIEYDVTYDDGGKNHEREILTSDANGDVLVYETSETNEKQHYHVYDGDSDRNHKTTFSFASKEYGFTQSVCETLKFSRIPSEITAKDITTTFNSYPTLKLTAKTTKTRNPVLSTTYSINILKNGKIVKKLYGEIKKGSSTVRLAKLDAGSYKLEIYSLNGHFTFKKTVNMKVNKLKATVKAPKVTNKFKKKQYFKMTVKKASRIKVKVKVYTGKKSKTYILKTDKKGVAKLNTKSLKRGSHKVVISSGDANYKFTAKSTIKIR